MSLHNQPKLCNVKLHYTFNLQIGYSWKTKNKNANELLGQRLLLTDCDYNSVDTKPVPP